MKRVPNEKEMNEQKDTLILAIESSCDETAAAVVKNGREVLSNYFLTDRAAYAVWRRCAGDCLQKTYRKDQPGHHRGTEEADVTLDDIDAIGVTYGPGLVGALL